MYVIPSFPFLSPWCSLFSHKRQTGEERPAYIHTSTRKSNQVKMIDSTSSSLSISSTTPSSSSLPERHRSCCSTTTKLTIQQVGSMDVICGRGKSGFNHRKFFANVCVCAGYFHTLSHIYSPIYLSIYTFIHINSR